MYRKCPIRRLAKRLPLSPEFQKAAILDEYVDAGSAPGMELDTAMTNYKPDLGVAGLKSRLKAAQNEESESLPPLAEELSEAPHDGPQVSSSPAAEEAGAPEIPNPFTGMLEVHEGTKKVLVKSDGGTALLLGFGKVPLSSMKQRAGKKVSVVWENHEGSDIALGMRLAD